jgi:putative transposase
MNPFTRTQIEQLVVCERLYLYNRGLPCGEMAIKKRLHHQGTWPLPSISTIQRILARQCLTHRRTGYYPQDEPTR